MKRIILFFWLALLTTLTAYAYDFYSDGIYYNKNSDGTSVSVTFNTINSYFESVVIPASVNLGSETYTVTSIGPEAFRSWTNLTSVTIPESVTSIEEYAFADGNVKFGISVY